MQLNRLVAKIIAVRKCQYPVTSDPADLLHSISSRLTGWRGSASKYTNSLYSPLSSALTCWAPSGRVRSSWSPRGTGSPTTRAGPSGPWCPPRPDHFLRRYKYKCTNVWIQQIQDASQVNCHRCYQICSGACEGSCCSRSVSGWCQSCPSLSKKFWAFHI